MGKEKQRSIGIIEDQIIKHNGLFDFDAILKAIPVWYSKHNYNAMQKAHSQKKKGAGGYLEATWVGEREVTDYVKFVIKVDIWLRDYIDVAIEEKGETRKMNKGNLEITFNSVIEKDYQGIFISKREVEYKFIREMYEKYVIKKKLQNFETKLLNETQDLIRHIQKFLKR
ncbi:MAG: hypothetical protein U9Q69_00715 [Nanoarchaeota archaeon]|nr:hypothetical protein [Nanoarchaeota archaeon]